MFSTRFFTSDLKKIKATKTKQENMMCLILLLFTASVYCLNLPSYLSPCSVSDPDLSRCIVNNYEQAWPYIVQGDPAYNLENHSPLILDESFIKDASLKITLKHMAICNLETLKLVGAEFEMADTPTASLKLQLTHDYSQWRGDYKMVGNLLTVPLSGVGESNITYVNGVMNYTIIFKKVVGQDGRVYLQKVFSDATFRCKHISFDFSNLLHGKPEIAAELQKIFSEGWAIITDRFGPSIKKIMCDIADHVITAYMTTIPIDKLFQP